MRMLTLAAVSSLLLAAGASAQSPRGCDRACLTDVMDAYLTAVIRGEASAAPLAPGYRATENAIEKGAGEGVWNTLAGLGEVQRRYLDTTNSSAAYFGTVSEDGGTKAVVMLRLKIDDLRVSEAEWIIARPGETLFNPDGLAAEPPPAGPIPVPDRASRQALKAAANSYFEGLERKDGSLVRNVPGCVRLENGTKVTQRRAPANVDADHAGEFSDNDCAAGLDRFAIRAVTQRRFPVIDEVQGVAVGYGMFLRPEGSRSLRLLLSEVFTTRQGQITGIYAAMHYMPADLPETMGWPAPAH